MDSPGGSAYGKPSTRAADDLLREQGWPFSSATYEATQAAVPHTPPQKQTPLGPVMDGTSVADGPANPLQEQPWTVGPGAIAVLALSLYALVKHARSKKRRDPWIAIVALSCLMPAATYPLLMLYGITLSHQLTADIILVMAAVNAALTLVAIMLILGAQPPRKPTAPPSWAKILKFVTIFIGILAGLYLILSWNPEIIQNGCRGYRRCLAGEMLFGSRREAFSTIWMLSGLLQLPFMGLYLLFGLRVRQYLPLWRR